MNQDSQDQASKPDNGSTQEGITVLSFIGSLFAGWFGVQSKANRERDFQHGKFHHFILGGIVFVILFIAAVIGLVQLVMHFATN